MTRARAIVRTNLSGNFSPLQQLEEDFAALVAATLAETGFAAADLTL